MPDTLRDHSFQLTHDATQMLVVGSSTATYSAFRLVRSMAEEGKPILVLNKVCDVWCSKQDCS